VAKCTERGPEAQHRQQNVFSLLKNIEGHSMWTHILLRPQKNFTDFHPVSVFSTYNIHPVQSSYKEYYPPLTYGSREPGWTNFVIYQTVVHFR
jgi:hypothetical protein